MMNLKYKAQVLIVLTVLAVSSAESSTIPTNLDRYFLKKYDGFEVVLNCEKHGLEMLITLVGKDTGNRQRKGIEFKLDPTVPADCQQTSTNYYPKGYHRGHILGANTNENSLKGYLDTFFMTNILPQRKELNTGAWDESDVIIECLRERGQPLEVYMGTIWDGPHARNTTLATHGTPIPDSFWKVIKQGSNQIAWIMPNARNATRFTLRNWESTVEEIQNRIGYDIPGDLDSSRNYRPDSWYNTENCHRS